LIAYFVTGTKYSQKKCFEKFGGNKKFHTFAPATAKYRGCESVSKKVLSKKMQSGFGGLKNLPYLCSPFPLQKRGGFDEQ
jgi:hypothetical protein